MKIIHYINFIVFTAAVGIYLYDWNFGLFAQIPLGAIQLVFSLALLTKKPFGNPKLYKPLAGYFLSVALFFVTAILVANHSTGISETFIFFLMMFIPMCIASFFVYVTYVYSKK